MRRAPFIAVWVSEEEIHLLTHYTFTPLPLLEKMTQALVRAKRKHPEVRRVKVTYSAKKLDKIIAHIAEQANQRNKRPPIQ